MSEQEKNGLSLHDMVFKMYEIIVIGQNNNPPLPEQVRNNTKEINYLKKKPAKWFNIAIGLACILNTGAVIYSIFK